MTTAAELQESVAQMLVGMPDAERVAKIERQFGAYVVALRRANPDITTAEIVREILLFGDAVVARIIAMEQERQGADQQVGGEPHSR